VQETYLPEWVGCAYYTYNLKLSFKVKTNCE
jgi:hypothetical protein